MQPRRFRDLGLHRQYVDFLEPSPFVTVEAFIGTN